jgi:hypothetical protein
MDQNRYIVCYPGGGITDMLSVIGLCLDYAIKHKRTLLIDTTYKTSWFKHDIFDYVDFTHASIYSKHPRDFYPSFQTKSVYPQLMKDNFDNLEHIYKNKAYHMLGTEKSLATNLSSHYKEDIVVYSNCGTSKSTSYLNLILSTMQFKNTVLTPFLKNYLKLPENYISIHIRNTDIKSNTDEFLRANRSNLKDKFIYLASDDKHTIDKFKSIYKGNIYNFSNIPNKDGENIHYNHDEIPQTDFIIDCFVDILLLAASSEYYYSNERSGYSNLANTLFTDKQLLHQITAAVLSPSSILRNRQLANKKPTL